MRFPAAAVSGHVVLFAGALLALDVLAHSHTSLHAPRHSQWKRDMRSIVDFSTSNPVAAAQEVQRLPYVPNNTSGDIDSALLIVQNAQQDSQLPWNSAVPFIATPDATLSPTGGWQGLPSLEGFTLNRSWEIVHGAIMPFYMTAGLEAVNVRRAVICWPGKPRDSWRYANLYRNALSVVEANTTSGVEKGTVMIVAPAWLNDIDQQSGAVLENELFFHGSTWEAGGVSRGPALNNSLSTYSIMDNFTDMLFDKAVYPNLNQVVIAGHSMGGQAAHRYAILKKQKRYDDNMSYWVGNPGSWTWLTPERPYHNSSCSATFDSWHYGLGQNQSKVTKYAQRDAVADKNAVVQRYLSRKVHMALGLLDVGPGDTHCEARDQGASHLDRGSQYVLHLANVNQGTFPPAQSVDFIANTSHQDFPMISTNASLHWLFLHDYDISHPDIAPSNPGDRPHKDPTVVVHRPHAYATDGNKLLATSLMAGSIGSVALFLLLLPFLFPANWSEEEDDPKQEYDDCLRRSSTLVEHTMPSRFRFPSTASSISDGSSTLKPFD